jgi:hypothetical protein
MPLLFVTPILTPNARLTLVQDDGAAAIEAELGQRIQNAFARGHGLSHWMQMKSESLFPRHCPPVGSLPHNM